MNIRRVAPRHSAIDILDRVLDKGLVIDASINVSLVGIEIVNVNACVVVAAIETYEALTSSAETGTTSRRSRRRLRRRAEAALTGGAVPRRRRREATVNARCEHGCTFVMKPDAVPGTVTCPFDAGRTCTVATQSA